MVVLYKSSSDLLLTISAFGGLDDAKPILAAHPNIAS